MQKLLPLALGLLALVAGGLALSFFFEARELRTELDALKRERTAQLARIETLEKTKARLQADAAAVASRPDSTPAAEAKDGARTAQAGARPAGRPDANTTRVNFNPDNPQFQRLMAVQQKAGLDARYAPLFKKLSLPPGQIDQLKTLLVEKQMALVDVMSAARAQGVTDRQQVRALAAQTVGEIDNNIRTLIGADGLQQLQQFERTAPQRALVDQLATRLSYTSSPLTPQQSEQLVQILADNAAPAGGPPGAVIGPNEGPVMRYATSISTSSSGHGPGPGGPGMAMSGTLALGGPTTNISDQAVSQAQAILSTEQLAALQQVRAEQQAQQQAMSQMMQEAMKNQEPGQPGGVRQVVIQMGVPGGPPPPPPPPPPPGGE
jgi:hypothetical protein